MDRRRGAKTYRQTIINEQGFRILTFLVGILIRINTQLVHTSKSSGSCIGFKLMNELLRRKTASAGKNQMGSTVEELGYIQMRYGIRYYLL
jgi:hypothetical protein